MTKPDRKRCKAIAADIAAWAIALRHVAEWDSAAAAAIRNHIEFLTDGYGRAFGLPEAEIAKINKESEAAVEAEIAAEAAATWRALEAALPTEVVAEIKNEIKAAGR
jgi:hypothetical protein